MTRPVKILLGVVVTTFCLGSVAVLVAAYFLISFVHGRSLFNEGYAAMIRRDYETAASKFGAALGNRLPKAYRAYAWADRALSESWTGRCDDAIRDYTEALRIDPNLAFAYENRGVLYDESGERAKAYDDFSHAIRLNPNAHRALLGRGLIDLDRKDLDQAIEDFSEAARTEPLSATAFVNRGIAYSYKKDFDHALANFDAALGLRPNDIVALAQRGYVYLQRKEFAKAITDLSAAIRIDPKHAGTYRTRALAYSRSGDYGNAITDFRRVLTFDPNDSETLNNFAWVLATCPDSAFRDGKQAVVKATAACNLSNWKNPYDIDTLAAAYAESGDFETAVKYEDQAASMSDVPKSKSAEMKNRRELYQQHKPYRQTAANSD